MSLRLQWERRKCLLGHGCCYGMPRDTLLKGPSPKDFVSALQFSPLYHGSQKPENCIFQTAMPEGRKGEGKRREEKKKKKKIKRWGREQKGRSPQSQFCKQISPMARSYSQLL